MTRRPNRLNDQAGWDRNAFMNPLHEGLNRVGGYQELAPPAPLAHMLECLWVHSPPPSAEQVASPHRVIPHFGSSLTLERRMTPEGELEAATLLFLGPVSRPRPYPVEAGKEMISLHLRPELCRELIGVEVRELWDRIEPYDALCPRRAKPLMDHLGPAQPTQKILINFVSWLAGRSLESSERSPGLETSASVIEHLRACQGITSVDALIRDHGRAPQYLRRVFKRSLGASPKRIASLLRLNAAIRASDGADRPLWADIAAQFGYSDQAHLIRETRRWTEVSPTVLHAERRAELNPYSLGESRDRDQGRKMVDSTRS